MARAHRDRRLDQTVAALRQRHGDHILRRASDLSHAIVVPRISTGFAQLDELTGCGGIPRRAITLLQGRTTSGKVTVAYRALSQAQKQGPVALFDLTRSADPHYIARCGVDLENLVFVRPQGERETVALLLDLVADGRFQAVVVDSLADLWADRREARNLRRHLAGLQRLLRDSSSALVFVDEAQPPWLGWLGLQRSADIEQWAALHLCLERENWLLEGQELRGYRAQGRLVKSRWAPAGATASVEIRFGDTLAASPTW